MGLTGADGDDLLNKYLDLKSEQHFGPQSESRHTKNRRNELRIRVKCMIVRFVDESFWNHFQRGRGGQSGHGRSRPKFESYNLKKLCSEIHRKNYNRDWKARVDLICEMMCELFRAGTFVPVLAFLVVVKQALLLPLLKNTCGMNVEDMDSLLSPNKMLWLHFFYWSLLQLAQIGGKGYCDSHPQRFQISVNDEYENIQRCAARWPNRVFHKPRREKYWAGVATPRYARQSFRK